MVFRTEPMRLDFYKQDGTGTPRYYDVLMNKTGSLLMINPRAMKLDKLTVVLEQGDEQTPSPMQVVSIYAMLSRYRWSEVTLWNLDV
jgi:hypothetical protein